MPMLWQRRRDKTWAIKQGMMQQLITGRVRLVCMSGFVPQERHGKRATAERCMRKCGE
jgi:hypothetical protein